MTIMLEIRNLSHRFGDGSPGLEDIDLKIAKGAFVVIAGCNGSGKTTLLRHLNGLLQPTGGSVWVNGRAVGEDLRRARQLVGMVFQDADSQIVGESVYSDVAFGPQNLSLTPAEIRRRVQLALAAVGLAELADQRPHLLSGGEKRRLAIAGILAMEPRVVVFDEPFANLDYPGVRQLLHQILRLHRDGHTIVLATHDLEKVLAHADRLVVMQAGRVVSDGHPADVVKTVRAYGIREPLASRLGLEIESWLN